MSFCHQCGEKVANEDIFCPYCGISITPVLGADDASMSETIVGMPPVLVPEPVPSPVPFKDELPADKPVVPVVTDDAVPVSGNTADNLPLMTESIEIPAGQLEELEEVKESAFDKSSSVPDLRDVPVNDSVTADADVAEAPMPRLISEQLDNPALPKPPDELETPDADVELIDSRHIFLDSEPKGDSAQSTADQPADDILQEDATEVIEEVEVIEVFASPESVEAVPDGEMFDDAATEIDTRVEDLPAPNAEAAYSPIQDISVDRDLPEPEVIVSPADETPIPVAVSEAEPFVAPALTDESNDESAKTETEIVEVSSAENEPEVAKEAVEPAETPAVSEPPIAMPEMPLLLENERASTELDSVQIIQKSIADSLPKSPASDTPAVAETPVDQREGRPYTTPNIGKSDTDGRRSAKLKPLDEGTILNSRYEIVRKIGGGGMGAVYLANDRNLGGVLRAVKEMVQSYIESEQQDKAIADFKRESLLLTSLDHHAIPTIYDYFYDEKEARFYLVMKYISGGDLAGRLRAAPEGRIDEKSVTEWAIQVADVLHYLHTHEPSIVYRDLKPANVMIDGNSGRVMLIDFGIARWVNKEEKGVTAVGTMGYAPPELFSGNVEPRSDIYSLGSTMFHLLTGADPQSNPLLIFDFQKNPRPRQINSQLSDQIEQILMRSVEYNADARFGSASELRDALKEHLNNLQIGKVTYGVKVAPSNRAFSEQLVFCGFCGKQIVATDVFCAFCGAQQPIAQQGVSQSSYAAQPVTAKLTLVGTGELEPSSFRLEKTDNLLGRRDPMSNIFPEVDLSKYDPQTKISRRHARVWRDGNSFLVEDLGSSNGTTLLPSSSDSVRLLPHQPRTLTNGDKIRLGDTTLHFTIG